MKVLQQLHEYSQKASRKYLSQTHREDLSMLGNAKEGRKQEINTITTTINLQQTKVNIILSEGPIATIPCVLAAEIHLFFC